MARIAWGVTYFHIHVCQNHNAIRRKDWGSPNHFKSLVRAWNHCSCVYWKGLIAMLDTLRRWAAMWRSVVGTMAQTEATDSRCMHTMCYTKNIKKSNLATPSGLATVLSSHLRMMDRGLSFSRPQCSGHTATCMNYKSVVHVSPMWEWQLKGCPPAHPRRSHITEPINPPPVGSWSLGDHRPCTKLRSLVALMRLVSIAPPNLTRTSEMERLGCKVIQFLLQGMTDEEIGKVRANGKPSEMAERLFCSPWLGDESSIIATNSQQFTLFWTKCSSE